VLDCPCSSFRNRWCDVHGTVTRHDNTIYAGTFTAAQNCAEVARVGHPINCNKERRSSFTPRNESGKINLWNFRCSCTLRR
jgi:hypothetical protein